MLPDFKTYYKVAVIKMMVVAKGWTRAQKQEPHKYRQLISGKGAGAALQRKVLSVKGAGTSTD